MARGLPAEAVERRIARMRMAFPDAEVAGYEGLIDAMTCDLKDRHVLAAAVRGDAEVLVTFNIRDFPRYSTDPYDLALLTPDDFLLDQLDLHPEITGQVLEEQVAAYKAPPRDVPGLLDRLNAAGVTGFVREAGRLFGG